MKCDEIDRPLSERVIGGFIEKEVAVIMTKCGTSGQLSCVDLSVSEY